MMKEMILDALVVEPGMIPYEEYIINDSEMLQFFLCNDEPYTCKIGFKQIDDGVGILYNADSDIYKLKPNRTVCNKLISGMFYVVGVDNNNKITSLTAYDKQRYLYKFRNI